jgi:replication initiation and membrane attachment protein DnaB
MGNSPKDGLELLSANMGYITQLPFIFKISERQRYKVIMQSINVSHEMFTRDMIPIRTVVQINLERLPDLASGSFKKFKQAEAINTVTQVIKNTSSSDIIAARRQRDGFI